MTADTQKSLPSYICLPGRGRKGRRQGKNSWYCNPNIQGEVVQLPRNYYLKEGEKVTILVLDSPKKEGDGGGEGEGKTSSAVGLNLGGGGGWGTHHICPA